MQDLIVFFKDIFMMNGKNERKVGLSQFKEEPKPTTPKLVSRPSKEIKLSDLMRKSA